MIGVPTTEAIPSSWGCVCRACRRVWPVEQIEEKRPSREGPFSVPDSLSCFQAGRSFERTDNAHKLDPVLIRFRPDPISCSQLGRSLEVTVRAQKLGVSAFRPISSIGKPINQLGFRQRPGFAGLVHTFRFRP